jgi:hypothetical protein
VENAERLTVRDRIPVVIGIAAAVTVASLFIRWGEGGMYSLGPTLPWAYFISSTFVGSILGSPRVLPHRDGHAWRSRMFATTYLAIGLAGAVSLVLNIVFLYPDGVQRNIHAMFTTERAFFTILGPLIYLVPLVIAVPASVLLVVRDAYKAWTVGILAVTLFTVALAVTELSAESLLYSLNFR